MWCVLLVDTVRYPMAIQKLRCTCQAVWLPNKRMLARIISEKRQKVAEKCPMLPKSAELCRILGIIRQYCRKVAQIHFRQYCRKVPKMPKSKIGQNTILGLHLALLLFPRFRAFPRSRFLRRFPAFSLYFLWSVYI
jgi:hypothetical protein